MNTTTELPTLNTLMSELGPAVGFTNEPQYFRDGDFVTVYFSEDLCFAERVDNLLTVYRSDETGELVGCKIKGVSELVSHIEFTIGVDDGEVQLKFVLLSAVGTSDAKSVYYDLAPKMKSLKLNLSEVKRRRMAA